MRHAAILHDLRNELLCRQWFGSGMRVYEAGSLPGKTCREFQHASELVGDMQRARKQGLAFLHYLLHPASIGGEVSRQRIDMGGQAREEIHGSGLLHLYLQTQGRHSWLVRLEAPKSSQALGEDGWNTAAIDLEARRMVGLMRRYSEGAHGLSVRYWR